MAKPDGWILRADVSLSVRQQLRAITGRRLDNLGEEVLVSALVAQVDLAFWNQLLEMFASYQLAISDKNKDGVKTIGDIVDLISLKVHEKYATRAMLKAFPPDLAANESFITGARKISKDIATNAKLTALEARLLGEVQKLLPALPIATLFVVPVATIRVQWTWSKMMQVVVTDVQQFEVH